jgi:hypothetical protein
MHRRNGVPTREAAAIRQASFWTTYATAINSTSAVTIPAARILMLNGTY